MRSVLPHRQAMMPAWVTAVAIGKNIVIMQAHPDKPLKAHPEHILRHDCLCDRGSPGQGLCRNMACLLVAWRTLQLKTGPSLLFIGQHDAVLMAAIHSTGAEES
jgi:hypothetical protein